MRRGPVVGSLLGLWLVAAAPHAGAHAVLESSSPEESALLDRPPAEIVLSFTEAPDTKLSRIELLDANGTTVETPPPSPVSGERGTLRVPLSGLGEGVYTVSWRVLSTVDGHVTAGAFGFGVGVESIGAPPDPGTRLETGAQRPSPMSVAGRWGFYWGLALLLGLAVTALGVFRGAWRPRGRWIAASWLLGALGLGVMLLAERASVGVSLVDLLGSDRGRVLVLRGIGLAAVGLAAIIAWRVRHRWGFVLLGAAVAGLMLIQAYAGHAGGATSLRWLKVGAQWMHLLAVGVWVGGLVWVLAGTRGRDGTEAAANVRRFSTIATVAIGAVVVTGGLRALNEVGLAPGRYVDSGFGLAVVAKVALFLPLAALGALNRFRNVPALTAGRGRLAVLRRTVAGEIAIAVVIFGITGAMAGLVPPTLRQTQRPATLAAVASGADFATTLRVQLSADPGTPGPNRFEARIVDYDTGEPVAARKVTLTFSLPGQPDVGSTELELERSDDDVWRGEGVNLTVDGTWRVGVLVEQGSDSKDVPLELTTRTPPQRITKAVIPGEPTIYTIELPAGASVQTYVDPGTPGPNEVHFTFFSPEGGEQPVGGSRIEAIPTGGESVTLEPRELSPGHLVASADLEEGRWRFRVRATASEGTVFTAYVDETIEEKQ